jgi:PPIC-type PPIASE domain
VRVQSLVPRFRQIAFLVVPLTTVSLLAACGTGFADNNMAISGKVGQLTSADLEAELKMLAGNEAFVGEVLQGQALTEGRGYNKDFVATVMQQHLFDDIIEQEAKSRNVKPAPMSEQVTANVLQNLGGSQAALDGFSAKYRDQLFLTQRYIEPLITSTQDRLAQPYFEKNQGEFATGCVTHLLVDTEDEAKKARARIVGGETFAVVAKEVSKDPGSGAEGGVLPCGSLSTYVAEFAAAAAKLPINELSQPIQTEFGFHVLQVTKRDAPTWGEETKAAARAKVNEAAITDIRASIAKRVKEGDVVVNPKYGVLDTTEEIPSIKAKGTAIVSVPAGSTAPPAEPSA